jgi:Fe-S cluster biogenesis protein NfuA
MAEILENTLSREKVEAALDKIRPHLQADGGDVRLIDVKDGEVKVKLTGACAGCPMATMTLRAGVERVLRQELPDMKKLVAV